MVLSLTEVDNTVIALFTADTFYPCDDPDVLFVQLQRKKERELIDRFKTTGEIK